MRKFRSFGLSLGPKTEAGLRSAALKSDSWVCCLSIWEKAVLVAA